MILHACLTVDNAQQIKCLEQKSSFHSYILILAVLQCQVRQLSDYVNVNFFHLYDDNDRAFQSIISLAVYGIVA